METASTPSDRCDRATAATEQPLRQRSRQGLKLPATGRPPLVFQDERVEFEGNAYTRVEKYETGQTIRLGAFADVEVRVSDVIR